MTAELETTDSLDMALAKEAAEVLNKITKTRANDVIKLARFLDEYKNTRKLTEQANYYFSAEAKTTIANARDALNDALTAPEDTKRFASKRDIKNAIASLDNLNTSVGKIPLTNINRHKHRGDGALTDGVPTPNLGTIGKSSLGREVSEMSSTASIVAKAVLGTAAAGALVAGGAATEYHLHPFEHIIAPLYQQPTGADDPDQRLKAAGNTKQQHRELTPTQKAVLKHEEGLQKKSPATKVPDKKISETQIHQNWQNKYANAQINKPDEITRT